MISLAKRAEALARSAHADQVDKAGLPYVDHPARVAARVRISLPGDGPAEAVAWLHDVVEDTSVTLDDLADEFGSLVAAGVEAITRRPGEDQDRYYRRVTANRLASVVKAADLEDNTDPARLAKLDPSVRARLEAKYAHARNVLAGMAE
ncbi:HD domain-containing protein [Nakamurella sp. PAMC28650]|jgi:(p)ppGpp synthase/HD superfamily hydrolase|uniref:HD domain-containing protein n=1 Tax=Nakamurella sp. PAMC28650 TaxID=2762325 RepID=UPI00164DAA3D|nr:HD domain-containing protein [Nakamurella sp. PAMC28650]QNK82388.1 bifunctional (p)ppGpp synthetase/guanosine-3',5'-bis(diphosphate) 3'-pyrophosphohydrolase [Nakamurella sp. PAMC28650]